MASCLGIYIDRNIIKYAKITKEKNRSIVDDYMIFEFIKDEWVWIGVMGD